MSRVRLASAVLCAGALLWPGQHVLPGRAAPSGRAESSRRRAQTRGEIRDAIDRYIKQYRPALGRVGLDALDVESRFALARIRPRNRRLATVRVLLCLDAGNWCVLALGDGLHGSGKRYDMPKHLWRKWGV